MQGLGHYLRVASFKESALKTTYLLPVSLSTIEQTLRISGKLDLYKKNWLRVRAISTVYANRSIKRPPMQYKKAH